MNVDRVAPQGGPSFVHSVQALQAVPPDVQYCATDLVLTALVPELLGDEIQQRHSIKEDQL